MTFQESRVFENILRKIDTMYVFAQGEKGQDGAVVASCDNVLLNAEDLPCLSCLCFSRNIVEKSFERLYKAPLIPWKTLAVKPVSPPLTFWNQQHDEVS